VLAAKMLATVDVLSKGRLMVGVGVGWMSDEIALLGGPPFAERAQASEEYIQAVRELWTFRSVGCSIAGSAVMARIFKALLSFSCHSAPK
jgi:alkanesulfonate monooxygenase SsuD/methylene tetrahydromethanopterin reductase-like flavin-dependent oxidoreductase (luciferase family)